MPMPMPMPMPNANANANAMPIRACILFELFYNVR